MLVEEYLVAVVSLPAGVFKPYSGVKTSILLLDKALARRTDRIAFFKVDNDGFDLGDQRRPIERNDLPQAQAEIAEYLRRARAGASLDGFEPTLGLIVEKSKIAANGDYNLSGQRYRENVVRESGYSIVGLGEVCEIVRGVTYSKSDESGNSGHQVLRANNISKDASALDLSEIKYVSSSVEFPDSKKLQASDIFICMASGSKDHIGKVAFVSGDTDYYFGGFMGAVRVKPERIDPSYLFQQLRHNRFNDFLREQISGANINNLGVKLFYQFTIPLPPLDVQREFVAEIEGYQRVIDGARAVVDNYRPRVAVDPAWPLVAIGEICERVQYGPLHAIEYGRGWLQNLSHE